MADYNSLAISATKRLQSSVGAKSDGYWGFDSQKELILGEYKLEVDWVKLRSHFGRFTQMQVDGFNSIISAINDFGGDATNPSYCAYMLATTWHETGLPIKGRLIHTMQPVEELGKGRGRRYGKRIDVHGGRYSESLPIYYGRGYVQLTWLTNYVFMKLRLGVDFVNHPELALVPKHAADIMITGMLEGSFTGKSLSRYIKYGLFFEFVNARRVINGTDKATMIGQYAVKMLDSLVLVKRA